MQARPFMLLGASALVAVERKLNSAAAAWAAEWGVARASIAFECRRAWEDGAARSAAWNEGRQAQQRSVWLGWQAEFASELQRLMFAPDGGYANHAPFQPAHAPAVAKAALEALCEGLSAAAGVHAIASGAESEPHAAALARGSGAAVWQLKIGRQVLRCMLDQASVQALCGPRGAEPPLRSVSYLDALGAIPVALSVEVGTARVGLGPLLSVGVGDVIRLDAAVDGPVAVRAAPGALLFEAYLGRVGESVAIEVASRN